MLVWIPGRVAGAVTITQKYLYKPINQLSKIKAVVGGSQPAHWYTSVPPQSRTKVQVFRFFIFFNQSVLTLNFTSPYLHPSPRSTFMHVKSLGMFSGGSSEFHSFATWLMSSKENQYIEAAFSEFLYFVKNLDFFCHQCGLDISQEVQTTKGDTIYILALTHGVSWQSDDSRALNYLTGKYLCVNELICDINSNWTVTINWFCLFLFKYLVFVSFVFSLNVLYT